MKRESKEIIQVILQQYVLPISGLHGIAHWARVLENGRLLAACTQANLVVVEYFALFHDACRVNEGQDLHHGLRGAQLASLLQANWLDLSDLEFHQLYDACAGHTADYDTHDLTIQTCYDADRLDLARAGIFPDPIYLRTHIARDPKIIEWANARSLANHLPDLIFSEWGYDGFG